MRKIIFSLIGVLVVGGLFYYLTFLSRNSDNSVVSETSNWKTYRNERYGVELKYPEYFINYEGDTPNDPLNGINVVNDSQNANDPVHAIIGEGLITEENSVENYIILYDHSTGWDRDTTRRKILEVKKRIIIGLPTITRIFLFPAQEGVPLAYENQVLIDLDPKNIFPNISNPKKLFSVIVIGRELVETNLLMEKILKTLTKIR